ncbi:adhesion G protein-coupled receptor F5-like [Gadus chalcogrammus]|uniref:adhesion G protein-coupled receptor F5-like n=1 Tax=Gadus chalcogrammus TaxID=1042646 RepID=UPI0024C47F24|nr:adhesion G protein-coupled receptor F5-like [Gadus chalcogrammus]
MPPKVCFSCIPPQTEMARLTLGLLACSLLLLYLILESKASFTALAGWRPEDIPPQMLRQKRAAPDEATFNWTYVIDIAVNGSSGVIAALNNISLPVQLNNITQISEIQVTTACTPVGAGEQCRCQEGFAWPIESCLAHGACDVIAEGVCTCINGRPADGQSCQPIKSLQAEVVLEVEVELHLIDLATLETLRARLENSSFPLALSPAVEITDTNITTVCSPFGAGFQCTCEDPYRWPCDKCLLHGSCDNITDETCGCINALPPDEEYCQLSQLSPPVVYEYLTTIELQTTNVTVLEELRSILDNISYPFPIDSNILISEVNITTVCSPFWAGFQCRCEDPYRWPCDKCLLHGSCDNITDETCGCINALPPDEEYCQLSQQIPLNEIEVILSVTLDLPFIAELSNPTSSQFMDLKERLEANYRSLTGFRSINVRGFSAGSVVVDFTIRTTTVVDAELTAANDNLGQSFESSFFRPFTSPDPITFPSPVYTGQNRTLTCGPPPPQAGIEVVTSVSWTLATNPVQNRGRFQITSSATDSRLTISNLVPSDRGAFTCTLVSGALRFIQHGSFTTTTLLAAPVLLVNRESNAVCRGGVDTDTPRRCCVQLPYIPQWVGVTPVLESVEQGNNCVQYDYRLNCTIPTNTTICRVINHPFEASSRLNIITAAAVLCTNTLYGEGGLGDESSPGCDIGFEGERLAVCQASGVWLTQTNTCILTRINNLLTQSEYNTICFMLISYRYFLFSSFQSLNQNSVPMFVANLSGVVSDNQDQITNSPVTISAIVDILINVGNVSTIIVEDTMQSILNTVDVIVGDDTIGSWADLNANQTLNTSSLFLSSMETITQFLSGDDFSVATPSILLNRTQFSDSFMADINSSLVINLQNTNLTDTFITTITFSTLSNVLPPRTNASFNASQDANATGPEILINAAVVLIQLNGSRALQPNLTLSYRKRNPSLTEDPQCVFWNFQLLEFQGGWDEEGCTFVSDVDDVVECNCDHLTSFSMLMSTGLPPGAVDALDIITYIGVAISIVSLVICLIIEALTWKAMTGNPTSYLRHVSLVNIAVSLLIADIWFIIGAAITSETDPTETVPLEACSAATFFIHLFYLALFFWMLVSALLLFYRTVMVFSHMSKATMLAIGFSLGYGAPLVIAVVTVAATAPQVPQGYIRDNNGCWLRWEDTFALLAFIIPAGVIVFINFVILIVVLTKMLRRGVESSHSEEKNTLLVILRSVAILFPTFGLTWALGVGVMVAPRNLGLHVTFALFNSLQGFFILVFGTLMDPKIRAALSRTIPALNSSSNQTRTTSGGGSSTGRWALLNRIRGRRDVYHVTSTGNTSSSNTASESYLNI